jgi:TusA-related sulfurtransferase
MMKDMRKGIFEVLVDTDTSKENVSRLAQQMGWDCEVKQTGNDYVLVLKKGEEDDLSR